MGQGVLPSDNTLLIHTYRRPSGAQTPVTYLLHSARYEIQTNIPVSCSEVRQLGTVNVGVRDGVGCATGEAVRVM